MSSTISCGKNKVFKINTSQETLSNIRPHLTLSFDTLFEDN